MHEGVFYGADEIRSSTAPVPDRGGHDAMLRTARWLDLGNDDPRMPPAFVIEFSSTAFTESAFKRHDVPLPAALQKAVPKRQAEFLMGRLAARQAIERLGVGASTPGIGPSREPLWQEGVIGSITHTGEMAGAIAVASSSARGIGIDIENVIDADTREAIRELAITSVEHALLETRREHLSVDVLLTVAFSAKESFFKGTFATVGRYFEFNAARVSCLDVNSGHMTLTLQETLCPALPEGASCTIWFKMLSSNAVVTSFVW